MQKIKMSRGTLLTFEEGCNKYLENCRQRNLRDGTINHHRQSYLYFYKYFDLYVCKLQVRTTGYAGGLNNPLSTCHRLRQLIRSRRYELILVSL